MFAIIETGGKQYKVQQGDELYIEKLTAAEGETVTFPVQALFGEGEAKVGTPVVEGASVTAKVLKTGKAKKITVSRWRATRGWAKPVRTLCARRYPARRTLR